MFCSRIPPLLRFSSLPPSLYQIPLCPGCTLYLFFSLQANRILWLACSADVFPEMEVRRGTKWWKPKTSSAQSLPPSCHPLSSPCKAMSDFPDYYAILGITKTATTEEIRTAYKRESLRYAASPLPPVSLIQCLILAGIRTHPDRLANATAAEKQKATERFQVRIYRTLPRHLRSSIYVCVRGVLRYRSWPMRISSCRTQNGGWSTTWYTNPRRSVRPTLLRLRNSLRISRTCSVGRDQNPLLGTRSGQMLTACSRMFSMRSVDTSPIVVIIGVLEEPSLTTFIPLRCAPVFV